MNINNEAPLWFIASGVWTLISLYIQAEKFGEGNFAICLSLIFLITGFYKWLS